MSQRMSMRSLFGRPTCKRNCPTRECRQSQKLCNSLIFPRNLLKVPNTSRKIHSLYESAANRLPGSPKWKINGPLRNFIRCSGPFLSWALYNTCPGIFPSHPIAVFSHCGLQSRIWDINEKITWPRIFGRSFNWRLRERLHALQTWVHRRMPYSNRNLISTVTIRPKHRFKRFRMPKNRLETILSKWTRANSA